MTKKPSPSLGLAAFGAKPATPAPTDDNATLRQDGMTPKGKSDVVACTVRLPRADWLKIQHLALDEGMSFQALAVAGLDAELKRRGLPGLG